LQPSAPASQEIECLIIQTLVNEYGIHAQLSRLPGENLNYLALANKDEKYIVKLAADDQSESFVDMEFLVLRQAADKLQDIRLPQIIETKSQNIEACLRFSDSSVKRLRIINFISGALLEDTDISDRIRKNVGSALAQFDRAVSDFDHPAAHRAHRWDLTRAIQHEHILSLLKDASKVHLLSWAFAQYKNINTGKVKQVKWQFVHGDANPENILIDGERVVGLLDFGDSCYNPRISELAICLPYLMMDQRDPVAAATPVIGGYQNVIPLTNLELDLLWPLILGRLATTICVATQRRQLDPDHPNWFVSEDRAWNLLGQLRDMPNPFL